MTGEGRARVPGPRHRADMEPVDYWDAWIQDMEALAAMDREFAEISRRIETFQRLLADRRAQR